MKTAYIFHDAFCDPFSDWYGWMRTAMEGMGYLAIVPTFPTPAGQSYESWKAVLKNYLNTFDQETVFIGHGTGGAFALRLLEETDKEIHGLFLVASYAEKIGHAGYDRVNDTFINHAFAWEKIRSRVMTIKVFAGDNDPFVPSEISRRLAGNLGEDLQVIPDGGHINKASGFIQAVAVAQGIKEGLSSLHKSIETAEPLPTDSIIQKPTGLASGIDFTDEKNVAPAPETAATPQPIKAHTMYGDMSSLVSSNKGTVASSILTRARTDQKIKKASSPTSPKNVLYIIGTIIVLLVAAGIFGYIVNISNSKVRAIPQQKIQSLIQADAHKKIDLAGLEPYALEKSVRTALGTSVSEGTILDIYYVRGANRISFNELLSAFGISGIPAHLTAEFDKPFFMHGAGKFGGADSHFLVIPVSNYDVAFASMKEWEPTLFRDLGIFMDVPDAFLKTQFNKNAFGSETISNQNIRALRYRKPADITFDEPSPLPLTQTTTTTTSSEGNFISELVQSATSNNPFVNVIAPYQENDLMLAYFFLNEKTLIVTDSSTIIPQILARYAGSQIYQ